MDLESKVSELNKEVTEGGSNKKTRSASDWIPRPPEKYDHTPLVNYNLNYYILLDLSCPAIEVP